MNKIPLANRAIAIPLLGLAVAWLATMGASFADLFVPLPMYDNRGNQIVTPETLRIAPYLLLVGIAAGSIASLIGKRMALRSRLENGDAHKLSKAALRFANLGLVVGLAAGAIFAVGNFLGAFNSFSGREESLGTRFLNVYLPIILATALVVYVLLAAFVFDQATEKHTDGSKPKMTPAQKALSLGYAVPILATAVAIIFGLVVYDVTRTNLQVWIWVIIITIVATGVVVGTLFANQATGAKPVAPKPKTALAVGAANLNFVLSIVFGSVVSIMSFTFGTEAISKLQTWSAPPINCKDSECNSVPSVTGPTLNWFFEELAPAKILLLIAIVGIYLTVTARNKEGAK